MNYPDTKSMETIPDLDYDAIFARHRERKEISVAEACEAMLERLRARFNIQPRTVEEIEAHDWKTTVVPHLTAIGIPDRHCRRIAPQWSNTAQERAFGEVVGLCNSSGVVVALIGCRGAGKTTIAAQIMRTRFEARREYFRLPPESREMCPPPDAGRYVKLGELGSMFKPLYADFGCLNRDELAERLKAWIDLELLVIDEIHESEDLKTHARLLVDLVDHRYARRNDTILISNHDGAEFRRLINPSILSRIGEHGKIIECRWPSWRAAK